MSLLHRLLPFLAPAQSPPARPPALLVEFLADRGRLDQELAALRAEIAAGDAGSRERLADLAEQLTAAGRAIEQAIAAATGEIKADLAVQQQAIGDELAAVATAIKDDQAQGQATLTGRLDELQREVGKLGREHFRATTLLEAQETILEEIGDAWREHLSQREREAADIRQALADLESQVRLGLVKDLLPVADALNESIRAADELLPELQIEPRPGPSLFGWLLGPRPAGEQMTAEARRTALEGWLQGLLLVERRLLALLEREDVRPILTVGEPFDPHRHVAVAVERTTSVAEGTIVREELRGYTIDDRVLRHAEVVVARGGNHE